VRVFQLIYIFTGDENIPRQSKAAESGKAEMKIQT
jgi:hypothetical protein